MMDLTNPVLLGPVQNQEHYMNGIVARSNNFTEPILQFLEDAYEDFGELTGRYYGLVTEYKCDDADTVFVSLGSAAENIEAAVDYLRESARLKVGSIHVNVIRPFPEAAIVAALKGKKNVIILERTDEALSGDNPLGRDIRTALSKAIVRRSNGGRPARSSSPERNAAHLLAAPTAWVRATSAPSTSSAPMNTRPPAARAKTARPPRTARTSSCSALTIPTLSSRRDAFSAAGRRSRRPLPLHWRMGRDHDGQEPWRDPRRPERPAV